MAVEFPFAALDYHLELLLSGGWTDVTSYCRARNTSGEFFEVTRGVPDEGNVVPPSKLKFKLANEDGRFSPRNPTGPYYGQLTRNTRCRLSVGIGDVRAVDNGQGGLTTPDAAAISITGDIDLRIDFTLDTWAQSQYLLSKGLTTGSQKSYALGLDGDGYPVMSWSTTGSDTLTATATSPVPVPWTGRKMLRAVLDVNNGASGRTITFYTSTDFTNWTQLGSPVIQAGTTSIFDSTSTLSVYSTAANGGEYHRAEVRNGIAGTAVANPDLSLVAANATSFADAAGRTWTAQTGTIITNRRKRFVGEISEWPVSWEPSGAVVEADITASGVLRRLGQGQPPLRSAYYRGATNPISPLSGLVAYYPLEDGPDAKVMAAGIPGQSPAGVVGSPRLASDGTFDCSAPLPQFTEGSAFTGNFTSHTTTGNYTAMLLVAAPDTGVPGQQRILAFRTNGTAARIAIAVESDGALTVLGYNADGSTGYTLGPIGFAINGKAVRIVLVMQNTGGNVQFTLSTLEPGSITGGFFGGTWNSVQLGMATDWVINPDKDLDGFAVGHFTLQTQANGTFDYSDLLSAYSPETAGARARRLALEEQVEFRLMGDVDDTELMGPQTAGKTLLELLAECADADDGILTEQRDASSLPGILYITRNAMQRLTPEVAVSYTSAYGLTELLPKDDDQQLVNDVTVSREDGSSERVVDSTGPLGVNTVGRYDTSIELNVASDGQLLDLASWQLHRGTVDEPRWPTICFDLSAAGEFGGAVRLAGLVALDVGRRLSIGNLPTFYNVDGVDALVVGLVERIGPWVWELDLNTVPASVFNVGVYDEAAGSLGGTRYSGKGTVLSGSLTTTATSVGITCPANVRWAHDDGDYLWKIGGEIMQVTAISGSGTAQTATVVRSINGVVKTHAAGAAVELALPAYYAL